MLIQILLPTKSAAGQGFGDDLLRRTRAEIVERFGGLTAYLRSPAAGAWTSPEGRVEEDTVVMIEIVANTFDREWWRNYAEVLKRRFSQKSILIRSTDVEVLDD